MHKALAFAWHLLQRTCNRDEDLLFAGGLWVFFLQFRRAASPLLDELWGVLDLPADDSRRWRVVAHEMLMCCLILLLLHIGFRCAASGVISCSDASEQGEA